jgi:hypothetical protein
VIASNIECVRICFVFRVKFSNLDLRFFLSKSRVAPAATEDVSVQYETKIEECTVNVATLDVSKTFQSFLKQGVRVSRNYGLAISE